MFGPRIKAWPRAQAVDIVAVIGRRRGRESRLRYGGAFGGAETFDHTLGKGGCGGAVPAVVGPGS